jgi:glycosyltransferase involved in cell wall biosynthesis
MNRPQDSATLMNMINTQADGTRDRPVVAIVAPCYNESEVLPISIPRLVDLLDSLERQHGCSPDSYVVLVDDGSRDNTWDLIASAASAHAGRIRGLRLSRNAGHQYALLAGLDHVTGQCDAAISIDADLQDDLEALPRMVAEFRAGAEIVLGVKESRVIDPALKKLTALIFYKGMKWMGVNLVENHADCRLMSARALENLARFPEYLMFLRGLQPLIHNRIATVRYSISPRLAGESKYPLSKMMALAWNGITSFSVVPLRLISIIGAAVFSISLLLAFYAFWQALAGDTLPGWASITVPLYLLGGMLMLSIGVVGEYVAKIFMEVKQRPRFLVDEVAETVRPSNAR